jgi:hypothetical protein
VGGGNLTFYFAPWYKGFKVLKRLPLNLIPGCSPLFIMQAPRSVKVTPVLSGVPTFELIPP